MCPTPKLNYSIDCSLQHLHIFTKQKNSMLTKMALYFYGNAETGKNYFFKQHAAYHNVPTNHTGVSLLGACSKAPKDERFCR
jgi:hypothetical protein